MLLWSMFMALVILTTLMFIPFQVAFQYEVSIHGELQSQRFWGYVLPFFDICYWCDIVVNFSVAIPDHGGLQQNRFRIARHYFFHGFLVDFVSSVAVFTPSGPSSFIRTLRVLRLVTYVSRVKKLKNGIEQIQGAIEAVCDSKAETFVMIGKFFMPCLLFLHLLSCGFYYEGSHNHEHELEFAQACAAVSSNITDVDLISPGGWVWTYWGEEVCTLDYYERYVVSIYWAFVTVTTVGYGDITGTKRSEYIFCAFATFFGTGLVAWMTSQITLQLTQSASANTEVLAERQRCEHFMASAHLPTKLRGEIRRYFERTSHHVGSGVEKQFIASLPADLRFKVQTECLVKILRGCESFQNLSSEVLTCVLGYITEESCAAGETVLGSGKAPGKLYLVRHGEVHVFSGDGSSVGLAEGSAFGECVESGSASNQGVCRVKFHRRAAACGC
jgi:hypothetical protein